MFEAVDGQSELDVYRSRRIDCVVLARELSDQSGFKVLVELVPIASRPRVAVVALTDRTLRGLHETARQNGAYACFRRQFTTGDDLDRAIQRAISLVGRLRKEDPPPENSSVTRLHEIRELHGFKRFTQLFHRISQNTRESTRCLALGTGQRCR